MKRPHHNTVNKQWDIASRALMISYSIARGQETEHDIDFDEALEACKKILEWGKKFNGKSKVQVGVITEKRMKPGDRIKLISLHHAMNPVIKQFLNTKGTILHGADGQGKVCVEFDKGGRGFWWWIKPSRLEIIHEK